MEESVVYFGDAIKALDDSGRVGGYAVRHKDQAHKDFQGDYFDDKTYLGAHEGDGCDVLFHHGQLVGKGFEEFAEHLFAPVKTKRDKLGLWAENVLNLADAYEKKVFELVKAGKLSYSTGSAGHMVKRDEDGRLKRWPIIEVSLTPTPADFENRILPIKSLTELDYVDTIKSDPPNEQRSEVPSLKGLLQEKLNEQSPSVWQLQSFLSDALRDVAAASRIDSVDVQATVQGLLSEFAELASPSIVSQINDYKESNTSEPFYLKSKLDEFIASGSELVSGSKLEEHSALVVSALEEFANRGGALEQPVKTWLKRVGDKQEFRANDPLKAGRVISEVNKQKMSAVHSRISELTKMMGEMQEVLSELIAMAEPKKSADPDWLRGLLAQFEMQRRTLTARR